MLKAPDYSVNWRFLSSILIVIAIKNGFDWKMDPMRGAKSIFMRVFTPICQILIASFRGEILGAFRQPSLTLLAELRQRQSPVRAIIVSAYGDMPNIRTAMNRGAFDFVTKPVDLNDLEITMRKTLAEIARLRDLDRRRMLAERARSNLSRYFSPHFASLLAERDEPLGAVRRQNVTVLFVDIVGFTRMAERMTPEAVVTMLRQFHERMTAQIFACGGSIEKYVGDEIFAVFGVPEPKSGDAADALRCAERMIAALEVWNGERRQQGEMPLAIGIGLNCGPAVIGDVGSGQSLSFTVIGDTVNTASRLQELTRSLNSSLVAAEAIIDAINAAPSPDAAELLAGLRHYGQHTLRGRSGPVGIWTWLNPGSSSAHAP